MWTSPKKFLRSEIFGDFRVRTSWHSRWLGNGDCAEKFGLYGEKHCLSCVGCLACRLFSVIELRSRNFIPSRLLGVAEFCRRGSICEVSARNVITPDF